MKGLKPLLLILLIFLVLLPKINAEEKTYVFQPCLSNNISIIRNNDVYTVEQPLEVASGFKSDGTLPSDERGLIKFDISSLPSGYRVKSARLYLYVLGVYVWSEGEWTPTTSLKRIIQVHRVTTSWKGWSFTYWSYATFPSKLWNTPGGDFTPPTAFVESEIPRTWNSWTVTTDVKAWYSGEAENYGWIVKDANEGDETGYKVEYNNWFYVIGIEYSPKLEVTLTVKYTTPDTQKIFIAIVLTLSFAALLAFKIERMRKQLHRSKQNNLSDR